MMYNKITLIGSIAGDPEHYYDPSGDKYLCFQLTVPPPPDDPQTYWGMVYDLRAPGTQDGWPTGDDTFQVICREPALTKRWIDNLQKGDILCVEGRLVLTLFRSEGELLRLPEILASDIIRISF
jgi:single-stranded DNA-binding protein